MSIHAWGCRDFFLTLMPGWKLCQGSRGTCPEVTAASWKEAFFFFVLESCAVDCVSFSRVWAFVCSRWGGHLGSALLTEVRYSQEKSQLVGFRGVLVYPSLNSYNLDVCACVRGYRGGGDGKQTSEWAKKHALIDLAYANRVDSWPPQTHTHTGHTHSLCHGGLCTCLHGCEWW